MFDAECNVIAIFGHRRVCSPSLVSERLYWRLEEKIIQGYNKILIGCHGDFDKIALDVCCELKKCYNIEINVVLTSLTMLSRKRGFATADIYDKYKTIMYDIENVHYKNKIIVSNRHMVDDSDLVICYVNYDSGWTGARQAVDYAKKKGKEIVNIFDMKDIFFNN